MIEAKPMPTPMVTNLKLYTADSDAFDDPTKILQFSNGKQLKEYCDIFKER
ncbi:hypothetical protein PIB30_056140 [Stylosanthes scabra]|uniref:Uncharacterized protein n=1 Tax=Stylosanthes scabra TaxID=79078 RepID=A0ABU6UIA1_9FABA|nr:hypothetical protein [Stylosanthes scabra]